MSQVQALEVDLRIATFPFTPEGEFMQSLCYCQYCDKCVSSDLVTWVDLPQSHPDFLQFGIKQISCHNPACIHPLPENEFL